MDESDFKNSYSLAPRTNDKTSDDISEKTLRIKEHFKKLPMGIEYHAKVGETLMNHCNKLTSLILDLKYDLDAKRHTYLMTLQNTVLFGMRITDDFLVRMTEPERTIRMFEIEDEKEAEKTYLAQDMIGRAAFLTMYMFSIENLIKTILHEFYTEHEIPLSELRNENYGYISKILLERTFGTYTEVQLDTFLVPSCTRNSLHSGGIWRRPTDELKNSKCTHHFKENEPVDAGWGTICTSMLDPLIDLLDEILKHEKIANLKLEKIKSKEF